MGITETSKKDRMVAKTYSKELGLSIVLYVVMLFGSLYLAKGMADGWLKTIVVMLPVLPASGVLFAVSRSLKRMDDYTRGRLLEVIALSGGVTALLAFSYGFLEGIAYPKLSGFIYYGVFMLTWFIIGLVRPLLERES